MTLILTTLLLSGLLAIAVGISSAVFTEFRLSGEITDSFVALYAADQGMEQLLYETRVTQSVCPGPPPASCHTTVTIDTGNGACARVRVARLLGAYTITSTGEFRCTGEALALKRALSASFRRE